MSDLISRAAAIAVIRKNHYRLYGHGMTEDVLVYDLGQLPSADATEVIRCKDCKHRRENCGMGDHRWCDFHRMTTRADDFCSYGRRKNDGSCKEVSL